MPRSRVNLSHPVLHFAQVGRVTEIARIPVLPGDSLSGTFGGVIHLAPFKREIVFDLNFTLLAFYCPYRHTYGNDAEGGNEREWLDFMVDGISQAYPTGGASSTASNPGNFLDDTKQSSASTAIRPNASGEFAGMPRDPSSGSQQTATGPLPDYGVGGQGRPLRPGLPHSPGTAGGAGGVKSLAALLSPVSCPSSAGPVDIPPHVVADYLRIWNYFLRNPRLVHDSKAKRVAIRSVLTTPGALKDDTIPLFGRETTLLPSMLTALHDEDPTAVNRLLVGLQTVSGGTPGTGVATDGLDLRSLKRGEALMRQQIQKYLMTSQNGASTPVINLREDYRSVHQATFGTAPAVNLVPRPSLIARSSKWASARQVIDQTGETGTSEDGYQDIDDVGKSLGVSVGRMVANVQLTLERKMFPEHGSVVVCMIPRFAPLIEGQHHFLDKFENFKDYLKMAADPMTWMETPYKLKAEDVIAHSYIGGSSVRPTGPIGYVPFGAWYHSHPSFLHPGLYTSDSPYFGRDSQGYPFKEPTLPDSSISERAAFLASAALRGKAGYTRNVFRPHFGIEHGHTDFNVEQPTIPNPAYDPSKDPGNTGTDSDGNTRSKPNPAYNPFPSFQPNSGPHMICHFQHKILARRMMGDPASSILGGF